MLQARGISMLVCKLAGCLFLLVSGVALPRMRESSRRLAREQLASFAALVTFIRHEIEHYKLPLGDILARYEGQLVGSGGDRPTTLPALFERTTWYSEVAEKQAERLLSCLGRGYCDEQLALCDEVGRVLSTEWKSLSESEEKKKKSERAMSFFGAAILVLLLL